MTPVIEAPSPQTTLSRFGESYQPGVPTVAAVSVSSSIEAATPPSVASAPELAEIESYRHVPFKKAGTRSVQYGQVSPLKPRKISIEADERVAAHDCREPNSSRQRVSSVSVTLLV